MEVRSSEGLGGISLGKTCALVVTGGLGWLLAFVPFDDDEICRGDWLP